MRMLLKLGNPEIAIKKRAIEVKIKPMRNKIKNRERIFPVFFFLPFFINVFKTDFNRVFSKSIIMIYFPVKY